MTVAKLKALAKERSVSLPAKAKKADIIALLKKEIDIKKPATERNVEQFSLAARKIGSKSDEAQENFRVKKAESIKKEPVEKIQKTDKPNLEWKIPPKSEEPFIAQERVAEAKYYTGPALQPMVEAHGDLPLSYGEEKITLLSRDPFIAFAYWEVAPGRVAKERNWFGWDSKLSIRVYDITGVQFDGRNAIGYYDQEVSEQTGSWYFDFGRPSHSFCADLGLLSPEGKFLTLVRSNYITMPRDGVSDVLDDEWMLLDEEFLQLYGGPTGLSSPQSQEMLKRRRLQGITSPGMFSRQRARRR